MTSSKLDANIDARLAQRCEDIFRGLVQSAQSHFTGPVHLLVDDATALQGREPAPKGRAAACAEVKDDAGYVYITWWLASKASRDHQDGVLRHELAHVALLMAGNKNHSERDADAHALKLWGRTIRYARGRVREVKDLQTIGAGESPRPARLDAGENPIRTECVESMSNAEADEMFGAVENPDDSTCAKVRAQLANAKCPVQPPDELVLLKAKYSARNGDWWVKTTTGWYYLDRRAWVPAPLGPPDVPVDDLIENPDIRTIFRGEAMPTVDDIIKVAWSPEIERLVSLEDIAKFVELSQAAIEALPPEVPVALLFTRVFSTFPYAPDSPRERPRLSWLQMGARDRADARQYPNAVVISIEQGRLHDVQRGDTEAYVALHGYDERPQWEDEMRAAGWVPLWEPEVRAARRGPKWSGMHSMSSWEAPGWVFDRAEDAGRAEILRYAFEPEENPSDDPIENPGAWNMKRIHALFGYPDGRIPKDAADRRSYRGVEVELRPSESKDEPCPRCEGTGQRDGRQCRRCRGKRTIAGVGGKGHRIVVHCGCGRTVGFGRVVQHAKVCDYARSTFFAPKKICNCDSCVREGRELDESECPNTCSKCGSNQIEWLPGFVGHNGMAYGGSWVVRYRTGHVLEASDYCNPYDRKVESEHKAHESQVFGRGPPDAPLTENPAPASARVQIPTPEELRAQYDAWKANEAEGEPELAAAIVDPTEDEFVYFIELVQAVYQAGPDDVNAKYDVSMASSQVGREIDSAAQGAGTIPLRPTIHFHLSSPNRAKRFQGRLARRGFKQEPHLDFSAYYDEPGTTSPITIRAELPRSGDTGLGGHINAKGMRGALRDAFEAAGWQRDNFGRKDVYGPPEHLVQSMGLVHYEDDPIEFVRVGHEPVVQMDEEIDDEAEGPQEEDLVTEDHRRFYYAGSLAFTVPADASEGEMWMRIDAWMESRNYWPNVWFISDHGNAHLMTRPTMNPAPSLSTVGAAAQTICESGVRCDVYEVSAYGAEPVHYKLQWLGVPKDDRSRGRGSAAMETLTAAADAEGAVLVLNVMARDQTVGTTSKARLRKFYKRFGFVENRNSQRFPHITEGMVREPR